MLSLTETPEFEKWLETLRDRRAAGRINIRIERLRFGHMGDTRPVGDGVSEMRIDYGPGYRLYVLQHGTIAVLLICGGDKGSQSRDIRRAKALAGEWRKKWP